MKIITKVRKDKAQRPLQKINLKKIPAKFYLERCPICLGEYSEKPRKSLTMLRCQHIFHRKCIMEWFMSASTCPNCRYDFPTDNQLYEEYKRLLENEESE